MASSIPQIADYFVVVGLPDQPQHEPEILSPTDPRPTANLDPITDVTVIFKALGDPVPDGYECIDKTPSGLSANLNFGSLLAPEVYLCFRRGRDRPALTDIGVMVEGERLLRNAGAVFQTPTGRIANINNASSPFLYITYSRSPPNATLDTLLVMDICVINASKGEQPPHTFCRIDQKINTGIILGADMHLCYRKARLRDHVLSFKPEVLSRYPLDDTAAPYPLNARIPTFCMPLGASLVVLPVAERDPPPEFFSFVNTHSQIDASESLRGKFIQYDYGYVLTFYEPCTIEQLGSRQINRLGLSADVPLKDQGKRIVSSKAICLLSQYAFFSEFKQYLTHIYKMSVTENHQLPIERFISHFLHEVPVPSTEQPCILAQLSPEDSILFTRPEEISLLPPSCASFTSLLYNLGVEKTLDVFLYALLGQSLLVNSILPSLLTLTCEAIKAMIFPFIWTFRFIPFCPLAFSDVVHVPINFIIGVDSSYFDMHEPPPEVICIDLDTGNISLPQGKKHLTAANILPKEPAAQLRARLEKVYKRLQRSGALLSDEVVDVPVSNERFEIELECRDAFLYFMATILRGHRDFLIVPTSVKTKRRNTNLSDNSLFRLNDFVKTRDKSMAKFFEVIKLGDSQNFKNFVEELTFSSKPQVFDFFNDCCRKVDEDRMKNATSQSRLIEGLHDLDNERTVVIPPPSALGLEEGKHYSYNNFPLLDASLFLQRPRSNSASSNGSSRQHPHDWNIAKRTRQEIKSSTALLVRRPSVTSEWAEIIEVQSYAVWFSVLPAFCRLVQSRRKLLSYAVSVARSWARFGNSLGNDQTPLRVIFALADFYRHPVVAVELLMHIRKTNFELSTATLALCNKVLYQTSWDQGKSQSRPARLWRVLRNVVYAMTQFKVAGVRHRSRSQQSLVSLLSAARSLQPIMVSGGAPAVGSATLGKMIDGIFKGNPQSSPISSKTRPATSSVICFSANALSHEKPRSIHDSDPQRSSIISKTRPGTDSVNADVLLSKAHQAHEQHRSIINDSDDFWSLPAKRDECRVQIVLCAANKCPSPKCGHILLEEDIMARWSALDSEFNVACTMCGHRLIPKLEVYLKDFRRCNENNKHDDAPKTVSQTDALSCGSHYLRRCQSEIMTKCSASEMVRNVDDDGTGQLAKRPFGLVGPISCLFLSPLALRKEIEQATERNNNSTSPLFADSSFVDNHERLYWNLLFVFARMKLPSHLPSLLMFSRLLTGNSNSYANVTVSELREAASHVNVLVVWDNLALYPMSERPLYWHWAVNFGKKYPVANALVDYRPFSRRLMTKLLTSIRRRDVLNSIILVLLIRRRGLPNDLFLRNHSMYRMLFNLCIVALGRGNLDFEAFDSAYFDIFKGLKSAAASSGAALRVTGKQPLSNEIRPFDYPPSKATILCRRAHIDADIYHDFEQKPNFVVQFPNKASMATADTLPITNEHHQYQPSIDVPTEEVVVEDTQPSSSPSTDAESLPPPPPPPPPPAEEVVVEDDQSSPLYWLR